MKRSGEKPPKRGTSSFFRKHDRILTSISAVIVFMTFLAREGFQDTIKNRRDSVESARREYDATANTKKIADQVGGVYITLAELTTEITHHPPGFAIGDLDGIVVSQFNFYKNQLTAIEDKLLSARKLLRALPQLPPESSEADSIEKQISELCDKMNSEETEIQSDAVPTSKGQQSLSPRAEKKLSEATMNYTLQNAAINDRIDTLVSKSLKIADAEHEKYLCWYHVSLIFSWVLYCAGASLGILTAIYGRHQTASVA